MNDKTELMNEIFTLNAVFEMLSIENPHRTNLHDIIIERIASLQKLERRDAAREVKE